MTGRKPPDAPPGGHDPRLRAILDEAAAEAARREAERAGADPVPARRRPPTDAPDPEGDGDEFDNLPL